ncbi:hypothetical protein SBY92_003586 [Candida maltosa Xu316]|uniref:Uncharacterized protein n=1 Tax=Candida maltosa (strain Xu316) TaxID=1245528 RepID=M3HRU8_CANMX|nr:hypothetical protein G210_4689 [Candida maltosa Xu316]
MNFITWIIYLIKINVLQILLNGSRNPSISLQYIRSPIFESPSKCTCDGPNGEDMYAADRVWMNNITDIPVMPNNENAT